MRDSAEVDSRAQREQVRGKRTKERVARISRDSAPDGEDREGIPERNERRTTAERERG